MTTQVKPIRGKVAKILNSREVALNIGLNQGVRPGMLFDISGPEGIGIIDPDTGEPLGLVSMPKTRVRIIRADDRLSVAATYRTKSVAVPDYDPDSRTILGTPRIFQPGRLETRYETLEAPFGIDPATGGTHGQNSCVATGDPVVQVIAADK